MRWLIVLSLLLRVAAAQQLKPGFDPQEYLGLLSLTFHSNSISDSNVRKSKTDNYRMVYRSDERGFLNRWTLYKRNDGVHVIDIRGTVNQAASWMANFYAAMIPATGSLQLDDTTTFNYQLAGSPNATVHAGWTISLGFLAPDILRQLKNIRQQEGGNEILLFGHSQGAAITFLLRSWLHYEQLNGRLDTAYRFKTYCSAAPKPGNLYYAYDFEFITRNGWQYTVVNAADWVPETPFSIQTVDQFNSTNPFNDIKGALRKQRFVIRTLGGLVYHKLEKKPRKAVRKFNKYLGRQLYKRGVRDVLPQLKEPVYVNSGNYSRAGMPIVLMPDENYWKLFPDSKEKIFVHHLFAPYHYLLKLHYLSNR